MATRLVMNRLCCDHTTELGQDETYIIVAGKCTNGDNFSVRYPAEGQHYNMNDGQQSNDHCIFNVTLCQVDILPEQSWDIFVIILEDDSGNTSTQRIAANILGSIPNAYVQVAGGILDVLTRLGVDINFNGSDDYIGSFGFHVSNNNGQVSSLFTPSNNTRVTMQSPGQVEFRFGGSGSDYVGNFQFIL